MVGDGNGGSTTTSPNAKESSSPPNGASASYSAVAKLKREHKERSPRASFDGSAAEDSGDESEYPTLRPETLWPLVEALREPLIVCQGRVRGNSVLATGRVLTANSNACVLLGRDLASVQSAPLTSLLATASGRPPPAGLVSKCTLRCLHDGSQGGIEQIAVECDCRVFSDGAVAGGGRSSRPLLFCHLSLVDAMPSIVTALGAAKKSDIEAAAAQAEAAQAEAAAEAAEAAVDLEADGADAEANGGASSPGSMPPELAEVQLETLRILVVEDDRLSQVAVVELCQYCGFSVTAVGSGEECLEKLEESVSRQDASERFNLVLCDVMMGGMDGREVLINIRRRYGDEMAVIMISANEQKQMVEACIRAGADSYLVKPLRIADFSNIWQFVMQQRCHKLTAERREMRYQRNQQLASMKLSLAERNRAVALAEADSEKAQRERAEADAARERAEQEAKLDEQRVEMNKEIMRLLNEQVRKYWLLARMCNDAIVHASPSGFFLYLSLECKAVLGYPPHSTTEAQLLAIVHPDDLKAMKSLCHEPMGSPMQGPKSPSFKVSKSAPSRSHRAKMYAGVLGGYDVSDTSTTSDSDTDIGAKVMSLRLKRADGSYLPLQMRLHFVRDRTRDGTKDPNMGRALIGAVPRSEGALGTNHSSLLASPGGTPSLGESTEALPKQTIHKTSESLSKLLAETYAVVGQQQHPGPPGPPMDTAAHAPAAAPADAPAEPEAADEETLAVIRAFERAQCATSRLGDDSVGDGWSTVTHGATAPSADGEGPHDKPSESSPRARGDSTSSSPEKPLPEKPNRFAVLQPAAAVEETPEDSLPASPAAATRAAAIRTNAREESAATRERQLRESAYAAEGKLNRFDEHYSGDASGTADALESGRAAVQRAQAAARETLLGFFPTALVQWPDEVKAEGESANSRVNTSSGPPTATSSAGVVNSNSPPPPQDAAATVQEGGRGAAPATSQPPSSPATSVKTTVSSAMGEADDDYDDLDQDSEGLLHLQLLRNYFVSRKPSDFSPLAAAIYLSRPPAPLSKLQAIIATPGCDVNDGGKSGWQPLNLALLGGERTLPTVRMLIHAKADVDAEPARRRGHTCLMLAAASRQAAALYTLLQAGASVNVFERDRGQTALQLCAAWAPDLKALRACELLMKANADLLQRTPDGQLAAYACALEAGNKRTAELLLTEAGAVQKRVQDELLGLDDESSRAASGSAKFKRSGKSTTKR